MLAIGDKMPYFEVVDQDGNKVTSNDLIGKKTVVYFYPKDNTSGFLSAKNSKATLLAWFSSKT